MKKSGFEISRQNKLIEIKADLVVVGGGLSGTCAAIVAAREGLSVVLIQDRPVLGGNASSEVRLWALGATSHMGNNNRWSREGGLINEILLDNLKRNKEGNPLIFDTILIEKVYNEKNITLLLNTVVYETTKTNDRNIKDVKGFCSQNSTTYILQAPFFCDASGDGIIAFQAGASFRMGAESPEEFDEGFAPNIEDYGNLLGHSLYFYTKDVGKPVSYTAPSFAIDNAGELPRIRNYQLNHHGCKLWWVEYGGRLDTIHQSEDIKFELWKVVYGLWDYVKNSEKYPQAQNLTLEWVGTIPGKRESRRFEGDYMLNQKDIVEQRDYYDRVAFGGWAMDLHPADGVYSKHSSCTQWHSKGVYSIPYRCYYSKDIDNLFLAGRIISASHVAFGSSRVMLTCSQGAQAVGKAAALCIRNNWNPRKLSHKDNIKQLQLSLNKDGQSIPRIELVDNDDLVLRANITASSELKIDKINHSGEWQTIDSNIAQLLPLLANNNYCFTIQLRALENTSLIIKLKTSSKNTHFTPDIEVQSKTIELTKGIQKVTFNLGEPLRENRYAYLCFMKNEAVEIPVSEENYTGITCVKQKENLEVSNTGVQTPPKDIGIDSFEFWTPEREDNNKNIAVNIEPSIDVFSAENIKNTYVRPTSNRLESSWVTNINDEEPKLSLRWKNKQSIKKIKLFFDCDFDNSLESILMGHPKSITNFVVQDYQIFDENNQLIYDKKANYQAINRIDFNEAITTSSIKLVFNKPNKNTAVSLFKISIYV